MLKCFTTTMRGKFARILSKIDEAFQENVGFPLMEISFSKLTDYFYQDKDPSSLGVIRMLFGLTMLLDIPEERGGSTMDMRWGHEQDCHFPLFPFLQPLPMPHMALVYAVLWFGALGVFLGYRFRMSAAMFAAAYWYLFLIEKSYWNNHSYLFGLVALLFSSTQANTYFDNIPTMPVTPGSCFICRCILEDASVVVVKKRGIQSLVAISVKRGLQENAYFLEKLNQVRVYDTCMKRSLDAYWDASTRDQPVPQWNYFILKYQFFILYCLAGVKKGSPEWLSGYAMTNLSKHWVFAPFRLLLTSEQTDYLIVHWFIFFFDLTVAFWMSWHRTRTVAVVFCVAFHLMNWRLFSIGMFPWVCLATLPLFYSVDWPKRLVAAVQNKLRIINRFSYAKWKTPDENTATEVKGLPRNDVKAVANVIAQNDEKVKYEPSKEHTDAIKQSIQQNKYIMKDGRKRKCVTCGILIYMIIQAFLPFSHFITKGYNNWTHGLYGYSWDMMVHSFDTILVVVKVVDNDNQRDFYLQPYAWTSNDRWTKHGDMVHQYAHCIKRNFQAEFENTRTCQRPGCADEAVNLWNDWKAKHASRNISVYVDVWCSMNGRFQQRMFNPKIDLLQAKWSPFSRVEWLMPLLIDHTRWRELLTEIRNEVHTWNNSMNTLFVADFPGYHLENFIAEDLKNVSLMVLEGRVAFEYSESGIKHHGGFTQLLDVGESVSIASGDFHKVYVVGEKPACYMYTYTDIIPEINGEKKAKDRLPIWREIMTRWKNMITFFKLIGSSLLDLFFGIPMTVRIKRT